MYVLVKFDGAVQGNVAPTDPRASQARAAYGFVILSPTGNLLHKEGKRIPATTSNEAELLGLLAALTWCRKQQYREVKIQGDSQLVIQTLRGDFRISQKPHLARRFYQVSQEIACHTEPCDDGKRRLVLDPVATDGRMVVVACERISRAKNFQADLLAGQCLGNRPKRERPGGLPPRRS